MMTVYILYCPVGKFVLDSGHSSHLCITRNTGTQQHTTKHHKQAKLRDGSDRVIRILSVILESQHSQFPLTSLSLGRKVFSKSFQKQTIMQYAVLCG